MQASAWVVDRPSVAEQLGHPVRADLVQLVDLPQHGRGVGDAQAGVEALSQPPVVHPHQHRRQPEVGVQPLQGLQGDQRQLDVVVGGQRGGVDDVDVGLGELAVAALLRALAPPHLLDLVAPEREGQLVRVLQHVAGERHRQVEVQAELGLGVLGRRAAAGRRTPPCRSPPAWPAGRSARRPGSRSRRTRAARTSPAAGPARTARRCVGRGCTRGIRTADGDGSRGPILEGRRCSRFGHHGRMVSGSQLGDEAKSAGDGGPAGAGRPRRSRAGPSSNSAT